MKQTRRQETAARHVRTSLLHWHPPATLTQEGATTPGPARV